MTNTANSKTLMRAQAVLCLLFTSLLVQCTCTSQFHTRRPGHIRHCYKDLFKSTGKLGERNDGGLYFRQLFNLTSYETKLTLNESCGDHVMTPDPVGVLLLGCSSSSSSSSSSSPERPTSANNTSVLQQRLGVTSLECEACCQTEMSISVPFTVTSLLDGTQLQVKHFGDSFQILNLGHCSNEGAACGFQGTCYQMMRVQWVLVTTDSGVDRFVPTTIPSHCSCIFS